MDPEIEKRLAGLELKIDAVFKSAERTRSYIKWSVIVSILFIVLPLLGLVFVIPYFVKSLGAYQSLLQ